jgi:hypothetical protein
VNPADALAQLAAALELPAPPAGDGYAAERALLDTNRVIPLVHVPALHRVSPRVRGFRPGLAWPMADVWVESAVARQ